MAEEINPEFEKEDRVPPVTLISDTRNSSIDSDIEKSSVIELSFVVEPLVTSAEEIEIVGDVLSYVQLNGDAAELEFPVESVNFPADTSTKVKPSELGVNVAE